jgi:anti-sigma factor RsiW
MNGTDCKRVREALDLGERPPGLRAHLDGCAACRREAARLERLRRLLAADAALDVPERLDVAVRARLAATPAARPLLRPGLAAGIGAAACLSLGAAIATAFAAAGAAERGLVVGIAAVTAYLVGSMVISIPLLVPGSGRRPATIGELR